MALPADVKITPKIIIEELIKQLIKTVQGGQVQHRF
jgi:hypothetical protein